MVVILPEADRDRSTTTAKHGWLRSASRQEVHSNRCASTGLNAVKVIFLNSGIMCVFYRTAGQFLMHTRSYNS
jgi:hypothetical protein